MKNFLKYTKFRQNCNFKMLELIKNGEKLYLNDEIVEDEEKKYSEGEFFLNIGYNFKQSISRTLSNLYPMQFKFRGKKVNSIEGVFQGIKYKDKKIQNLILNYSGVDAYHTRSANQSDFWGETGILYWQGKPMNRHSEEYQLFIDELFSALSNPLYRRMLNATGEKYLLHHIGRDDSNETVLTRSEYEERLNTLRAFIREKQL